MRKKSFGRCPFDFDEDVKKIAAINKYIHAKFERHKNKIDNLKGVEQKLMVLHYFNVLNELSNQAIFSLSTGAFSASEVLTRVRVEFYSKIATDQAIEKSKIELPVHYVARETIRQKRKE